MRLENIVIKDDLTLALIDFAHMTPFGEEVKTSDGIGRETLRAPELNCAVKNVYSDKADSFALAGCFFQLEFFKVPFGGDSFACKENEHYKYFF